MDLWVLGCGPSLAEVHIPPQVFTIGVNNSYKRQWSPIYATVDYNALRRDYGAFASDKANALVHFTAIDPSKYGVEEIPGKPLVRISRPERPQLKMSGPFAYWLALQVFKADRVFLLGFDMESAQGHFDGSPTTRAYGRQRERLKTFHSARPVPTYIWQVDKWLNLEALEAPLPPMRSILGGL